MRSILGALRSPYTVYLTPSHCYDNARMESFFATLKKDLLYKIPTYKMRMEDVKAAIFYYVFVYYNKTRIYTTNPDALPPAVYRALCELTNVVAA